MTSRTRTPVLVSRCLLGEPCRYDGRAKTAVAAQLKAPETLARVRWIPLCPESDGGLPTPRPPCEIERGGSAEDVLAGRRRIVSCSGSDATAEYLRGARHACRLARLSGARLALLKARSPSCSPAGIHDGSFTGTLVPGRGITAEALSRQGLRLWSEEELDAFLAALPESEHLE